MTTKTALFALLAAWGVGTGMCLPAYAEEHAADGVAEGEEAISTGDKPGFTNRVWTQTGTDLPGVMTIFLSDGTLVQDSCWETHRLSAWQMTSDTSLSWEEDGARINAEIVSIGADSLVLSIKLGNETIEEHYVAQGAPFVCPDLPKGA